MWGEDGALPTPQGINTGGDGWAGGGCARDSGNGPHLECGGQTAWREHCAWSQGPPASGIRDNPSGHQPKQ